MSYHILITVDVEDWFQVENFKQYIPFSSWSSHDLRVEKNTHRILDLLDSIKLNNPKNSINSTNSTNPNTQPSSDYKPSAMPALWNASAIPSGSHELGCISNPKATFFVLGWIAERLPRLVQQIHSRGHEIASHGYHHILANEVSSDKLKTDLIDSKKLLEDIIGDRIYGYRAPSFFIDMNILKIIEESGYLYDSSFNSFGMHGRYGQVDFSQNDRKGIAIQIPKIQNPKSKIFYELPISNLKLKIKNLELPWGGVDIFG